VNILPPRQAAAKSEHPEAPRTRTFEELTQRHQEKIRALQEPLSKHEKEQADLATAKSRWERSKQNEKEAMARRQAEKEAALARRSKEENRRGEGGRTSAEARHSRPLSADRLAAVGATSGSGRRASTAKVQEWQKYQQEADKDKGQSSSSRRRASEQGVLPFPQQPAASGERRRSRSGVPRDPPS